MDPVVLQNRTRNPRESYHSFIIIALLSANFCVPVSTFLFTLTILSPTSRICSAGPDEVIWETVHTVERSYWKPRSDSGERGERT